MAESGGPLDTLNELLAWEPASRPKGPPLLGWVPPSPNRKRTLICHDMMGGYLPEEMTEGHKSEQPCFRFLHWPYVDAFIYFSHHFVTIPPPAWIRAAHANRTPILGTLITEWEDGASICSELLSEKVETTVSALVAVAEHCAFDGWLINIENPIQSGFFQAADGIFLNYNWNKANIEASLELAAESGRELDVYVGIDVFGRGCLGGGGFNTAEALAAIRSCGASAAIFAPGWVYETQPKQELNSNIARFYNLLRGHLYCRRETVPLNVTNFGDGDAENGFCLGRIGPQPHFLCQSAKSGEEMMKRLVQKDGLWVFKKAEKGKDKEECRLFCLRPSDQELLLSLEVRGTAGVKVSPGGELEGKSAPSLSFQTLSWTLRPGIGCLNLRIVWPFILQTQGQIAIRAISLTPIP